MYAVPERSGHINSGSLCKSLPRLKMADASADAKKENCEHGHDEEDIWDFDWKSPNLPWQVKDPHPLLVKHEREITDGRSDLKVLIPLCGVTVDLLWFADRGHSVVGIEYDASGCQAFFEMHNLEYVCKPLTDEYNIYTAKTKDITVYQCDVYKFPSLAPSLKGLFDVIWDRAALRTTVELPDFTNTKLYLDVLHEMINPKGKLAQENTRFDITQCKFECFPLVVSDEFLEQIAKEKWNIQKVDQLEFIKGDGLELFYRDYDHDVALHLLTPK